MHGALVSLCPRCRDVPTQIGCPRPRVHRKTSRPVHRRRERDVTILRRQNVVVRELNGTLVGLRSRRRDVPTQIGCCRSRVHLQTAGAVHRRSKRHVTILGGESGVCSQQYGTRVGLDSCRSHIPIQVGGANPRIHQRRQRLAWSAPDRSVIGDRP